MRQIFAEQVNEAYLLILEHCQTVPTLVEQRFRTPPNSLGRYFLQLFLNHHAAAIPVSNVAANDTFVASSMLKAFQTWTNESYGLT